MTIRPSDAFAQILAERDQLKAALEALSAENQLDPNATDTPYLEIAKNVARAALATPLTPAPASIVPMLDFVEKVSRMKVDGEELEDGTVFEMTIDDAYATVNDLIVEASDLVHFEQEEAPVDAKPASPRG